MTKKAKAPRKRAPTQHAKASADARRYAVGYREAGPAARKFLPYGVRPGLRWRENYHHWAVLATEAASKHGVSIVYGDATKLAWEAGVPPETYVMGLKR